MGEHKRILTIPKNETGIEENDYGVEDSENIIMVQLPEWEFKALDNSGIIDTINRVYHLLIDEYETENIPREALSGCLEIVRESKVDVPVFTNALKQALNFGTLVECTF